MFGAVRMECSLLENQMTLGGFPGKQLVSIVHSEDSDEKVPFTLNGLACPQLLDRGFKFSACVSGECICLLTALTSLLPS